MHVVKSGLLAMSMAALAACTTSSEPAPSPNIVPAPAPQQIDPPELLIVISVDQLSSDLYRSYLPHFTGGMARMAQGMAFLEGYQAQAATETCPGHSTINTGSHPARTGIVANDWYDPDAPRENKEVYCAEDEARPAPDGEDYVVSPVHLLVPTLGDLMKAANPQSRNVAVAGKDRAAVMMGGHNPDQRFYFGNNVFVSDLKVEPPAVLAAVNEATSALVAKGIPALESPDFCASRTRSYPIGGDYSVGARPLQAAPGSRSDFRRTPAYDGAVLALAAALVGEMELGRDDVTDLLSIGLSATDYVGHAFGNGGLEMCQQMAGLDASLGDFFNRLDASGIDYAVVLTADHGVMDIPARLRDAGVEQARDIDATGLQAAIAAVGDKYGVEKPIAYGTLGDIYLDREALAAHGAAFANDVKAALAADPQVVTVYDRAEIMAHPVPTGDPRGWSTLDRVRASYHPARSGDLYAVLRPYVQPITNPMEGYVATHGSVNDYDRRVPILFWRKGMPQIVRSDSAMTVDIMPTLAAMIGLDVDGDSIDGKCLNGVPGTTC